MRRAEPYRILHTGRRWYLLAWDLGRDDWRTFRVDRVSKPLPTNETFTARALPPGGAEAFLRKSIGYEPYRHRARIRMLAPIEAVQRHLPPAFGLLEAEGEDSCVLSIGGGCPEGLSLYIAATGFEFEVLDSPEMVERLRKTSERLARAAERSHAPA
jgi:predicted DNA-binding transcriptional regulator YafY